MTSRLDQIRARVRSQARHRLTHPSAATTARTTSGPTEVTTARETLLQAAGPVGPRPPREASSVPGPLGAQRTSDSRLLGGLLTSDLLSPDRPLAIPAMLDGPGLPAPATFGQVTRAGANMDKALAALSRIQLPPLHDFTRPAPVATRAAPEEREAVPPLDLSSRGD